MGGGFAEPSVAGAGSASSIAPARHRASHLWGHSFVILIQPVLGLGERSPTVVTSGEWRLAGWLDSPGNWLPDHAGQGRWERAHPVKQDLGCLCYRQRIHLSLGTRAVGEVCPSCGPVYPEPFVFFRHGDPYCLLGKPLALLPGVGLPGLATSQSPHAVDFADFSPPLSSICFFNPGHYPGPCPSSAVLGPGPLEM